jgi:hypothetical protein
MPYGATLFPTHKTRYPYACTIRTYPYHTIVEELPLTYRTHSGGTTLTVPYPIGGRYPCYYPYPYWSCIHYCTHTHAARHGHTVPMWRIYPYRTVPIVEEIPILYPYPRWSRIHYYTPTHTGTRRPDRTHRGGSTHTVPYPLWRITRTIPFSSRRKYPYCTHTRTGVAYTTTLGRQTQPIHLRLVVLTRIHYLCTLLRLTTNIS